MTDEPEVPDEVRTCFGETCAKYSRMYESYHGHKERMAWTATAVYLSGLVGLVTSGVLAGFAATAERVAFTILLGVLALLIFAFVSMQFWGRWAAADIQEGLIQGAFLATDWSRELAANDLRVAEGDRWPQLVQERVDDQPSRSEEMRNAIVGVLAPSKWGDLDNRARSEAASYWALSIATIAVILLAWI